MLSDNVSDWIKDLEDEEGYIFLVDVSKSSNEMDDLYNVKTSRKEDTIAYEYLHTVEKALQKIKEENPGMFWMHMIRKDPKQRINIYGKKDKGFDAYDSINVDIRKIKIVRSEERSD